MGRSILAYTERIVRPDELDWQFHQGSHSYSRFHVVAEDEERAASSNHSAVKRHTHAAACHCQFSNTSLEEITSEVITRDVACFLEESVRLVAVAKVG